MSVTGMRQLGDVWGRAALPAVCALAITAAGLAGCASTESDNASVRPWNSPEGWQGGALGGMDYQHR